MWDAGVMGLLAVPCWPPNVVLNSDQPCGQPGHPGLGVTGALMGKLRPRKMVTFLWSENEALGPAPVILGTPCRLLTPGTLKVPLGVGQKEPAERHDQM